ncbi:MAG UNVERIFIED_CONTAM: hypothetical protein LVR18_14930 [Planctomycetaceae bacterium]
MCIYLDGLSQHLHGNPATAEHDRRIRDWLRNNGYEVIEIAASELFDRDAMTRHFRKLAGYLGNTSLRERLRSDLSWFEESATAAVALPPPLHLRATPALNTSGITTFTNPAASERYVTCLPLIPLRAAAGAFGDPQHIPDDSEWSQWISIDIGRKLRRGMFVAQVVGKSMEPRIPDGSFCIFAAPVNGNPPGQNPACAAAE